jgi:hypothetical protein
MSSQLSAYSPRLCRPPGAQIATPFDIDIVAPAGARFRSTGHDDVEFVGQVSELVS